MEHHKHGGNGALLRQVISIPTRILRYHDLDGLSGLLLHHLCSNECFNLNKAAYFVDNPDFDHLVGIAGFSKAEAHDANVWDEASSYSTQVQQGAFHQQVSSTSHASIARKSDDVSRSSEVNLIAQELGISSPQIYSWPMKHGNYGVLIYEGSKDQQWDVQDLYHAASLLSFCPI